MATKEEMSSILSHKPLTFEQIKEIEAMYQQHDWETLRHQAAIAAMQGLLCAPSYKADNSKLNMIAKDAVSIADALIEELKKK